MSDKRALVTGAGMRVGREISLALAGAGYDLAVHYRQSREGAEGVASLARTRGLRAEIVQADLRQRKACVGLVNAAIEALGGLDLLVVNAAEFVRTPLEDLDEAAWNGALELNLSAGLWLTLAATEALRQTQGNIVFVTCSSTTVPFRNYLPYVVAKGGLRHLMKTLALELAPKVRVNAVAPGTVLPPPDMGAAAVARLVKSVPLGRVGSGEDIARAVVYLAGASYVTGEEIRVDGGRALARVERFER